MKIILIIGLPGSGKTELAKSMKYDILIDDPKSLDEVLNKQFNIMIITDPNLCYNNVLQSCITILKSNYLNTEIECLYFENDPKQCLINSKNRQNKKLIA